MNKEKDSSESLEDNSSEDSSNYKNNKLLLFDHPRYSILSNNDFDASYCNQNN